MRMDFQGKFVGGGTWTSFLLTLHNNWIQNDFKRTAIFAVVICGALQLDNDFKRHIILFDMNDELDVIIYTCWKNIKKRHFYLFVYNFFYEFFAHFILTELLECSIVLIQQTHI